MGPDLVENLFIVMAVFISSGFVVVISGIKLARHGDALAESTGWGRLWVGTIFLAAATSLPELFTDSVAVYIGAEDIGIGDILGSNMLNIFILAGAAFLLVITGREFFQRIGREANLLSLFSIVMTGLVILLAFAEPDVSIGIFGLGAIVILGAYLVGMKLIHIATNSDMDPAFRHDPILVKRAIRGFLIATAGIAIAAPFLAISAEAISDLAGISSSFVGILFVSVITSLPEASATAEAVRSTAYGLVVGNLYGSCIFNIVILALMDLMYTQGPISSAFTSAHILTALGGFALMFLGLMAMQKPKMGKLSRLVPLGAILVSYPILLYVAFTLG